MPANAHAPHATFHLPRFKRSPAKPAPQVERVRGLEFATTSLHFTFENDITKIFETMLNTFNPNTLIGSLTNSQFTQVDCRKYGNVHAALKWKCLPSPTLSLGYPARRLLDLKLWTRQPFVSYHQSVAFGSMYLSSRRYARRLLIAVNLPGSLSWA